MRLLRNTTWPTLTALKLHVNIAGIRAWEEPTEYPGAFMVRTDDGCKGRGMLFLPVKNVVGYYPGGSSVSHNIQRSG